MPELHLDQGPAGSAAGAACWDWPGPGGEEATEGETVADLWTAPRTLRPAERKSPQGPPQACSASEMARRAEQYVTMDFRGTGSADALPAEIRAIAVDGSRCPGDSGSPMSVPPAWYDEQLFLAGQRCAREYYAGVAEAELLSLFLLFSFPAGLDPLIATGRSDTPEAAGRRYLSTALRLQSWYSSDPFDAESEARKNLVAVRRLHAHVRDMCNRGTPEELGVKFTIGKDAPRALKCPMTPFLRSVFADLPCAAPLHVEADRYRRPFLTQGEMAITQFGFFGLFICRPDLFAAPRVTRAELEALVHVWAVLGYCLGIEDRFNWCLGGFDVVRRRCLQYIEAFAVPNLKTASAEWEHMSRCMVEGMRTFVPLCSFEANLAYLTEDVLVAVLPRDGVDHNDNDAAAVAPNKTRLALSKALSWRQFLELWRLRLFLHYLPKFLPAFNRWMSAGLWHMLTVRSQALNKSS